MAKILRRLAKLTLCMAVSAAFATSGSAQQVEDAAYGVKFFERVAIGDVEITPVAVFEDTRCRDYRLCFRNDELVVSTILWRYDGKYEVILRRDELSPVPGGALLLTDGGVPPVDRGAIPLNRYRLDILFIRLP